MAVGLTANNRVGVFSVNSPEWMITLQVELKLIIYAENTVRNV